MHFAFKCRHDKLNTREHGFKRIEEITKKGKSNAWINKKKRFFNSPKCPFGCDETENITHIIKCRHTEKIRKETLDCLEKRGIKNIGKWLTDNEDWKAKWFWMGLIPKQLREELEEELKKQNKSLEITKTIKDIQISLLEGTQKMWKMRCKKLFTISEPEKEIEKQQQREKRKSKHRAQVRNYTKKKRKNPSNNDA